MSLKRVYRSKVDGPIAVVTVLSMLVLVYLGASLPGQLHGLAWAVRLTGFCGLGLCVWTLLGTYYTVDSTKLTAYSGPFHWTVALHDIRSVQSARDLRSSPALSLDRLRIEFGPGRVLLVSPREKAQFLADLVHRGVQGVGT